MRERRLTSAIGRWGAVAGLVGLASAGCGTAQKPPAQKAREESAAVAGDGPAGAAAPSALVRQVLARAAAREGRAAVAGWRCWAKRECTAAPSDAGARDREIALELLAFGSQAPAHALRAAARMALDDALATVEHEGALDASWALAWDGEAPFVRADLPALLLEAPPDRRAALLALASPFADQDAERAQRAAAVREELGARAGHDGDSLLALRVGLDAAGLRALALGVLDDTERMVAALENGPADLPAMRAWHAADLDPQAGTRGPWVSTVGGGRPGAHAPGVPACFVVEPPDDVRFVPGTSARAVAETRFAAGCVAAARRVPPGAWDPLWVLSVSRLFEQTAWLGARPARDPAARARHGQAYVLAARSLAARTLLLLDGGDRRARDKLAMRAASPGKKPLVGASALFPADETGAAVDALFAAVVAASLDDALSARFGGGWAGSDDPRVSEELARLGGLWHAEGARAVLRAVGRDEVDASAIVTRARALTGAGASPGS